MRRTLFQRHDTAFGVFQAIAAGDHRQTLEAPMPSRPYAAISSIPTENGVVYIRKSWSAKQNSYILVLDGKTAALATQGIIIGRIPLSHDASGKQGGWA